MAINISNVINQGTNLANKAGKSLTNGLQSILSVLPTAEGGSSKLAKVWNLEGIDDGFQIKFLGQFIAEGMKENAGSVLSETSTVGKEKPDFQYLRGEGEQFSFSTKMYATNSLVSLRQQIQMLKMFTKRDRNLKRLPRALFTSGTEIALTVFVKSVELAYEELRDDGTIRAVNLSISLQIIDEKLSIDAATSLAQQVKYASGQIGAAAALFSRSARGILNIPGASLHTIGRNTIVRYGDTFESIAAKEYGNALLGDVLRRAQPQKEPIKAGDQITLVDSSEIAQIDVTQQSVFLRNTATNLALRQAKLDLRNRPTVIIV